ncbi:MAG TPA: hypothetical protein VKC90_16540 [Chitinophagaceae bacterium]|nr:hypothetical protein [Chitinophagaceae bacterium]
MMRTYLSPVSGEEKKMNKIKIRDDFYTVIAEGYSDEMKDKLAGIERHIFFMQVNL